MTPDTSLRINLLPWRETRQLQRRRRFCIALVVSTVLALVLAASAVWLIRSIEYDLEQRNMVLRSQTEGLRQRAGEQTAILDAYQQQRRDLASSRRMHLARMRQLRALTRVPALMPSALTLTDLHYQPPTVALSGSAGSARQVNRWIARLSDRADIVAVELQSLVVGEGDQSLERQVYHYQIRFRLNAPDVDLALYRGDE